MNGKCIRVMIVDDLAQVRESLATVLNLAGRNTSPAIEVAGEAQNGVEAVQQAQNLHPDVVLMDLEMPTLDGYEATRRIKAEQPAPRVIILSIHAGSEEQQRAREAGADGFVVKGDSYQFLLDTILAINETIQSNEQNKGENHG